MSWDATYFPQSMARLSHPVREKAISLANARLAQGYDERRATRMAIAQAKRWAVSFWQTYSA